MKQSALLLLKVKAVLIIQYTKEEVLAVRITYSSSQIKRRAKSDTQRSRI
jgi:hypothetical protein